MGLNPVQFGSDVIEQFCRFLKGSFPIIDDNLKMQFNDMLKVGEKNLIAKGPYIYLNKPFVEGSRLDDLQKEPIPFEEYYTREEIVKQKPRILLTNYSQLEYLLLRNKDLELFATPTLKFIVFDEVHTYTGALGS